jgi:hypothetical protein
MFNVDPKETLPKGGPSFPTEAYIGPMKVVDFSTEDITKQDGSASFEAIRIKFELLEGDQKGRTYEHTEFKPNTPEKAVNLFKRLCHITNQFYPGEDREEVSQKVVKRLAAESFADLKANFLKTFRALKEAGHLNKVVKGKLVPNVFEGKTTLPGFPKYVGFLADERSGTVLTFSKSETATIEEYTRLRQNYSAPQGGSGAAGASEATPAAQSKDDFDF